jgi:hypothetical protein
MTDLDHPCKQTCSGWEQGRERGYQQCLDDLGPVIGALEHCFARLTFIEEHSCKDKAGYESGQSRRMAAQALALWQKLTGGKVADIK